MKRSTRLRKKVVVQQFGTEIQSYKKKKVVHRKSSKEYEVERILDKRKDGSRIKYLLKWKDFPESENEWVDKSNLKCSDLIKEFEDSLKKKGANNIQKKTKETIVPIKRNLRSSKSSHSNDNSQEYNQSLDDFVITLDTRKKHTVKNVKSNEIKASRKGHNDSREKHAIKNVKTNETETDRKRHNNSREKLVTKNVQSNETETDRKRHNDAREKHTAKNVKTNEIETARKRHDDSLARCTVKNAESNKHDETLKKRQNDSGEKLTRTKNSELNKFDAVQKRLFNDCKEKLARIKNIELEHEIAKKKYHIDSKEKLARIKNTESNEYEVLKERQHIDYKEKNARIKNVELNEQKIAKKRQHSDSKEKPARIKNTELNEYEITKKKQHIDKTAKIMNMESPEHDIEKQRQHIVAGLRQRKLEALKSSRSRKMPKIQNLQYYVKSSHFPIKRKNGMLSVMRVSFQGTDVLKGMERFVEAGIAPNSLPEFLYDKPIKTGATEFQFTV